MNAAIEKRDPVAGGLAGPPALFPFLSTLSARARRPRAATRDAYCPGAELTTGVLATSRICMGEGLSRYIDFTSRTLGLQIVAAR